MKGQGMKTTMRDRGVLACLLIGLGALSACATQPEDDFGGHTNWLPCKTDADCTRIQGASCKAGYCVGADDEPLLADASTATGAATKDAGSVDESFVGCRGPLDPGCLECAEK